MYTGECIKKSLHLSKRRFFTWDAFFSEVIHHFLVYEGFSDGMLELMVLWRVNFVEEFVRGSGFTN